MKKVKKLLALTVVGSILITTILCLSHPTKAKAKQVSTKPVPTAVGSGKYRFVFATDPYSPCWGSGYWNYFNPWPYPTTTTIDKNFPSPILMNGINDIDITLNPGCCGPVPIGYTFEEQWTGTPPDFWTEVPNTRKTVTMPANALEAQWSYTVVYSSNGNASMTPNPGYPKIIQSCTQQ